MIRLVSLVMFGTHFLSCSIFEQYEKVDFFWIFGNIY